jgi:hypothetical protein
MLDQTSDDGSPASLWRRIDAFMRSDNRCGANWCKKLYDGTVDYYQAGVGKGSVSLELINSYLLKAKDGSQHSNKNSFLGRSCPLFRSSFTKSPMVG